MSTDKLYNCDHCEKILFDHYCDDGYQCCKDCYFNKSDTGRGRKEICDLKNENLALKKKFIFDNLLRVAGLYTDLIGQVFEYMPPEKLTPNRTAVLCEKCNVYYYHIPNSFFGCELARTTCYCEDTRLFFSSDEESSDEEINEDVQFFSSDEEE